MKKLVLFLFTLLSFSVAYAQPGSLSQSVIRYRVNDSTAAIAANVSAIAAGYAPMFYNNQATTPHWDVWNGGTSGAYDHVFDFNSGSGGAGGHTIEEEGTPLTARTKLNFVGAGVTATDDSGDDATVVTIPSVIGAQDLFLSAAAMWPRATNPCADLTRTEVATSLFNIQTLDFDQTTQEYAQVQVVLPRNWNNGTITATPYWTAGSGSGGVVWSISGGAYSNDDALSVAFGSAQTSTDTFIAANDVHIGPTTSAITLAGTPADADFIALQITRVVGDGSDTLNADAKLLGIRITLTLDASTSE